MKDDSLTFSCTLSGNLFKNDGERMGVHCTVVDGIGNGLGHFDVSFKNVEGKNKMDLTLSKNLIGNLIMDSVNLDNLLDGIL